MEEGGIRMPPALNYKFTLSKTSYTYGFGFGWWNYNQFDGTRGVFISFGPYHLEYGTDHDKVWE